MNRDFRDLLAAFHGQQVEYHVVGAHALAAHGHVRATEDLDIWIRPSPENASRVYAALADFGAPFHDLTEKDLATIGTIFQIGVPPVRIDIITTIAGVGFGEAWSERFETSFADQPVGVLSRRHLLLNKQAAGRPQDLADVNWLREKP